MKFSNEYSIFFSKYIKFNDEIGKIDTHHDESKK